MMLKKYFGTKQFYRTVISIAFPIMAQQFITTFVNLIDNVMIGSIGNIALTSVTVANRFFLIMNSILFGLCGAAGIYISGLSRRKIAKRYLILIWLLRLGQDFYLH